MMKKKILVFGGTGLVGSRVLDLLGKQFDLVAPTSQQVDVRKKNELIKTIEQIKPEQILYAAGYTNVDLAQKLKEECFLLNVTVPQTIAQTSNKAGILFYYLSTDYVFDGTQSNRPYTEEDQPNPVDSVYAQSKRQGEIVVLDASDKNCVIRLIMPFSAVHKKKLDIARIILNKLRNGEKIAGTVDQKVNPIFVDDLVLAIGKILQRGGSGIYHVGAVDFTTPYLFMKEIARQFKLPEDLIGQISFEQYLKTRAAKRPQHTWLDTTKFRNQFGNNLLHTIEEEIRLFKSQVDSQSGFS